MKNVVVEVNQGVMTIKVDLSKNYGISKSGKSKIIASSEGNQTVLVGDQEIKVGLNVYKNVE